MPRSIWKGSIVFGLVSVPVSLYSAVARHADISFRLLHKKDSSPIDYRRFCQAENVEVPWDEIVKGYEHEKGQFVVLTEEDFARAKSAGTETIEIRDFVPGQQIDYAYFESPYWLEPTKAGRKAYVLLRDALEASGRVGIGTFVMRQREHLAALRPSGPALMLTTLRFADEIRPANDLDIPQERHTDKRELALALELVNTLASDWKPEQYTDTYHEVLRQAIEAKIKGHEVAAPPAKRPPKVVNLMAALEASLKEGRKPGATAPSRTATTTAKKAPARGRRGGKRAA